MFEVFVAIFAALGLIALLWTAYGAMLMPVGRVETLELRLIASGDGTDVEQMIRGLCWLKRAGLLRGKVVILDRGLTPKGRADVEYLCSKCFVGVKIVRLPSC